MRTVFVFLVAIATAAPVAAQMVQATALTKAALGLTPHESLWPRELDGDPRTREALGVRMNKRGDGLEFKLFAQMRDGSICHGEQWFSPWDYVDQRDWVLGGNWELVGDRFRWVVNGPFTYGDYVADFSHCQRRETRR